MAKAAVGAARIEMSINSATFERQMERARRATNEYRLSLKNVGRQFDKFGKKMQSVGSRFMARISAPLAAVAGVALRTSADFEKLRQSMDILNGSVAEGGRNFERLKRRASQTPFQLADLAKAQNMLQGFGMSADDAFNSLNMIGDIAAVTGGDIDGIGIAFGQAAAEGKLFTRDIRQLINQGVPAIKMLADTMGVAQSEVLDLASQGEISFEILQKAFRQATTAGGMFANGMQKQSRTLGGVYSTMKDNISIALAESGDLMSDYAKRVMRAVTNLTRHFTDLDRESKKRILGIVATIGLMPPAIFAVGTAFIAISATISALLSPITAVVAAIGGLAAAVLYVWDNWKAVKERISDVSWWRNMVINMIQFINDQFFRRIFDGFNAIFKFIGGATLANPFDAVSKGLDALKADTKEYEHQFGSFTEAVMNGFRKMTGFDLSGMFKKAAATIDEQFGEGIGRRTFEIDMKINPPDKAQLVQVGRTMEDIIGGMESRWSKFKRKFEEIGGEFKSFLAGEMSSAVLSFGDALGRSLSGAENNWQTTFEKITMVVLEFAESLAKLAAGIGAVMMFVPGLQGAGAGLLAAATALQAITSGFRAGIEKRAANRQSRAQDTNIPKMAKGGVVPSGFPNDSYPALLSSGERVIPEPMPLDSKNMYNNRPQQAHVSVNIQGREIMRAIEDILYKYNR